MGKIINHKISGHNFHGRYSLVLRGPAEGFALSEGQSRRYGEALCGMSDCQCGGGYGDGPDSCSAIITADGDILRLVPAEVKNA